MANSIELSLEDDRSIAKIKLNRPDNINAITPSMSGEIVHSINQAESNDNIRVIILKGNGGNFSAGYDMSGDEHTGGIPSVDQQLDRFEATTTHIKAIWNCNKPVIAAVEGYCLAGGSDLAMICDQVISTKEATFGYPGIRMGAVPPTLIYPFVMNLHEAKELLLSGKLIDAERALALGMVNKVVKNDNLMDYVYEEASEILKVPGNNVRILKHIINGIAENQGVQPMLKYSEMFDALAHHTEYGKKYYELASESDFESVLDYLNKQDKGMEPN